jgi:hypothetical protein
MLSLLTITGINTGIKFNIVFFTLVMVMIIGIVIRLLSRLNNPSTGVTSQTEDENMLK